MCTHPIIFKLRIWKYCFDMSNIPNNHKTTCSRINTNQTNALTNSFILMISTDLTLFQLQIPHFSRGRARPTIEYYPHIMKDKRWGTNRRVWDILERQAVAPNRSSDWILYDDHLQDPIRHHENKNKSF